MAARSALLATEGLGLMLVAWIGRASRAGGPVGRSGLDGGERQDRRRPRGDREQVRRDGDRREDRAALHAKMGDSYKSMGGAAVGKYCESIVKNAGSTASDYEQMAAAHREMASPAAN